MELHQKEQQELKEKKMELHQKEQQELKEKEIDQMTENLHQKEQQENLHQKKIKNVWMYFCC